MDIIIDKQPDALQMNLQMINLILFLVSQTCRTGHNLFKGTEKNMGHFF